MRGRRLFFRCIVGSRSLGGFDSHASVATISQLVLPDRVETTQASIVKPHRERRAIAEAERWGKWQLLLKAKQRAYEKAKRRSKTELKSALDAGGSVWVFGTGPFGEFTAPAPTVLKQGDHKFEHYDVIRVSRVVQGLIKGPRDDPPRHRAR